MKQVTMGLAFALALTCAAGQAADNKAKSLQGLQEIKREAKQGPGTRLAGGLLALKKAHSAAPAGVAALRDSPRRTPAGLRVRDGYVAVSVFGTNPAALRDQLVGKGMVNARAHKRSVSGEVPITSLDDMASTPGVQIIRGTQAITHAGLVTSQGDRSLRSNIARARTGVDGRGVRVGVLSDSFNCAVGPFAAGQRFTTAQDDIANGDLPADIHVLQDLSDEPAGFCSDEGRAMMQIIHDVAPGASQSFYTAFISEEDFANGILALAADGAKVIVDDIIYFAEPMFENGIIADAVNTVKSQGVSYFSSAGNQARAAYHSKFRLSAEQGLLGPRHDFQPNDQVDGLQKIVMPGFADTLIVANWDEPSISANGVVGSRSDIDVLFYENDGITPVTDCFFADITTPYCQFADLTFNEGGDAVERVEFINLTDQPAEVQLSVEVFSGPAPTQLKYVWFDFGDSMVPAEFDTQSGTVYGHANAEGAEAVGAAWWFDTGAFRAANHPQCDKACVNSYSSAGGTPILFDDEGVRKHFPFVGFKPGVTGPDGGNTTFFFFNQQTPAPGEPDDFPNFFGTSAAAPHVAAVAALMLDQRARDIAKRKHFIGPKQLLPDVIYAALRLSADDIRLRSLATADPAATVGIPNGRGFDFDSGFGLVDAQTALKLTAGF